MKPRNVLSLVTATAVLLLAVAFWVTSKQPRRSTSSDLRSQSTAPEPTDAARAEGPRNPQNLPPLSARAPIAPAPPKSAPAPPQTWVPVDLRPSPPRIDDPKLRAAYQQWWVQEAERRVAVFASITTSPNPLSPDELQTLLEDHYDAAEARQPSESRSAYGARLEEQQVLWQRFFDAYGATLKTALSRGSDPQYGRGAAPPALPQPTPTPTDSTPPQPTPGTFRLAEPAPNDPAPLPE